MKPSVPRHWLFLLAGVLWTGAGFMLLARAYGWISVLETGLMAVHILGGMLLGSIFFRYMFIRVVRKNIERIQSLPEDVCIFAFTAWKGYILIAAMVTLGILAKDSAFPKPYLAVIYVAMGGALATGSLFFHKKFYSAIISRKGD